MKSFKHLYKIIFFIFIFNSFLFASAKIELSEVSFEMGYVSQPESRNFVIKNIGDTPLKVNLRSTCDCFIINKTQVNLLPQDQETISFILDPDTLNGKIEKEIIVETNDPEYPYLVLYVYGETKKAQAEHKVKDIVHEKKAPVLAVKNVAKILFFYDESCSFCRNFLGKFFPKVMAQYKDKFILVKHNTKEIKNLEYLFILEHQYQAKAKKFPAIVILDDITKRAYFLAGKKEIYNELETVLKNFSNGQGLFPSKEQIKKTELIKKKILSFSFLTVGFAGLIDGINPCAFTVLIFFISYLSFIGAKRKEIIIIGLAFILSVFITYFIIGLGLREVIETLSSFILVSKIIRYLTASIAICLGIVSFIDAVKYKKQKDKHTTLQLSPFLKKKIHNVIRNFFGKNEKKFLINTAFTAFITGCLVSFFELACTGQIYFPTLVYISRAAEARLKVLGYLLTYNCFFVLPLIVIFLLFLFGVSSDFFARISRKYFATIKFALSAIFIVLGVFIIMS